MRTNLDAVWRQDFGIGFGLMAAAFVFAIACAEVTSDGIATSKLCPTATAKSNGDGTSIEVTFQIGCGVGGTVVDLAGADSISCEDKRLKERHDAITGAYYEGSFPSKATGEKFDCVFSREDEEVSFSIAAPQPFQVTSPAPGATLDFGTAALAWSPSGSSATLTTRISGTCVVGKTTFNLSDTGSGSVEIERGEDAAASCASTIEVERGMTAKMPKDFEGGSLHSTYSVKIPVSIGK